MLRPISLLLAVLLAACSAAGPSATPSGSPNATLGGSPSATPGGLDHPTGARDVILRIDELGGFVAPAVRVANLPEFTLYGDGRAIYRPAPSPGSTAGPAADPLRVATLSEPQLQALLAFALSDGRLRGARANYSLDGVADAPTTVFSVNGGGVQKTVSVYALGIDGPSPPAGDAADRAAFAALSQRLGDFGGQVAAGAATGAGTYEPAAYRAVLNDATPQGEARDWPWPDVGLDAFKAGGGVGLRRAVLTPDQAKKLVVQPQGGGGPVLVLGPDRAFYFITLRPLLPDETA